MNTLKRAMNFLLFLSSKWWLIAGLVAINLISFQFLFWLESRFESITGRATFDTQNTITSSQLSEQLPAYVNQARLAYITFSAYDFLFPLIAGLTVAVIVTTLLRLNPNELAKKALKFNLPLLLLLGTLFDYLENIALLVLISGDLLNPNNVLISLALLFKACKLFMLAVSAVSIIISAVWLVIGLLRRRVLKSENKTKTA